MNHPVTDDVFFYWFTDVFDWTKLLILFRITLLILLIPDFEILIKRHKNLFGKSSFWSLIVKCASVSSIYLFHQNMGNFSATFLAVRLMLNNSSRVDFLKVLVTFSINNLVNINNFFWLQHISVSRFICRDKGFVIVFYLFNITVQLFLMLKHIISLSEFKVFYILMWEYNLIINNTKQKLVILNE